MTYENDRIRGQVTHGLPGRKLLGGGPYFLRSEIPQEKLEEYTEELARSLEDIDPRIKANRTEINWKEVDGELEPHPEALGGDILKMEITYNPLSGIPEAGNANETLALVAQVDVYNSNYREEVERAVREWEKESGELGFPSLTGSKY
jgi:hypothetical protein